MRCLVIIFLLTNIYVHQLFSLNIHLGMKVGMNFSFAAGNLFYRIEKPIPPQFWDNDSLNLLVRSDGAIVRGSALDFSLVVHSDIFINSWFSVGFEFQYSGPKKMNTTGISLESKGWHNNSITLNWQEFVISFLPKFYARWWYIGFGSGIIFATKPSVLVVNNLRLGNNLQSISKASISLGVILETGFNIPIGNSSLIQLAWRSYLNVNSIGSLLGTALKSVSSPIPYFSPQRGGKINALITTGLYTGYTYSF